MDVLTRAVMEPNKHIHSVVADYHGYDLLLIWIFATLTPGYINLKTFPLLCIQYNVPAKSFLWLP